MDETETKDEEIRICKKCLRVYVLTMSDRLWYARKGWTTPLRCADCRFEDRIGKPFVKQ